MTTCIVAGSERSAVGRKRRPQSKAVSRTVAGRIGARLATFADKAGLSADELGERIGKSGDMVRLYYSGRFIPPVADWQRIAKALGIHPRDIYPD